MFFRGRKLTIFGSLEPVKPRIHESVKFGNLDSWSNGVTNMRKPGTSSWRWRELRRTADSGICQGLSSWVTREDMREPAEKQGRFGNLLRTQFGSHAGRHSRTGGEAKSKFRVWTSGRFVNMLGEKDILVCVHTGNILWHWGCFGYVKVPSSPYKRGRKGACKRIQTFWNLGNLQRESQSLCALTLYSNVLRTLSLVLGKSSELFG
jgi:hypothetical protein